MVFPQMKETCVMRDYALNEAVFRGEIGSPWLARLWRNWKSRRAIAGLEKLDDRLLRDIGLTRADLHWATGLPLSENAALALEERQRRAGRGRRLV
jgi:uncharacterized protein YjiS (DUF1127 family)